MSSSQFRCSLACAFHQHETLTNFCLDKKCLLPLCPTCVKIHTVEHIVLKTTPQYEQINALLSNVLKSVKESQQLLSQDLLSIQESQMKSQANKQNLINSINTMKHELIKIVEQHCQSLIQEIRHKTEEFNAQAPDLDRVKKSIAKNLDSLKVLEQSLYLDKPMRSVIKYLGKDISDKIKSSHAYNQVYIQADEARYKKVYVDVFPQYPASFRNFLKAFLAVKTSNGQVVHRPPVHGVSTEMGASCDNSELVQMSICEELREVTNNYETRRISITDSMSSKHHRSVRGSQEKHAPHHHGHSRAKVGLKLVTAFDDETGNSIVPGKYQPNIRRVSFNKTLYLKNKENLEMSMRAVERFDQTML